ncbi:carboxypeptidase-like regulatory domain-containing protein [Halopiger goleimassiliensis]|uniref:carboxypeptidase-like regulatory domain-containing protein n=1 Tax=Halopiger goleimassiliensis TaxID=1293048 RepID=UPI0006781E80|nr:carboxypeptidase-like regulatory domain-containing protein [Halopiger goleimassiliensis]
MSRSWIDRSDRWVVPSVVFVLAVFVAAVSAGSLAAVPVATAGQADDGTGASSTIEGTVTDAETGDPIPNASVEVVADGRIHETATDADGRYAVSDVTGDREVAVLVEREGYESVTETRTVPADETTTVDVSLAGRGTIEVDVADAHFGDGIGEATVEATASGSTGTYAGTHVGNGTYRLENVPTGTDYALSVGAPGYVGEVLPVAVDGERVDEAVTLRGNAALEVIVETEDGELVVDASVSVERDGGARFEVPPSAGDRGTFEITVPGTGESYVVEADAPEFESTAVEASPVERGETVRTTVALTAPVPFPLVGTAVIVSMLCAVVGGAYVWRQSLES